MGRSSQRESTTPDATALPGGASRTDRRVWIQRGVVVAVWVIALILWRRYQSSNDLSAAGAAQRFIDNVQTAWWGVAAYVGVYLARPIVLFPASVLTVAGGLLFGPYLGVAVVIVAANASAMVAFGIGRLIGAPPRQLDEAATSLLARWTERMRTNSFETVLVMRLVYLPYDLVNYAAGALHVRTWHFLLATALGSLPGTVSFVLLGASLERVDDGIGGIDAAALVAGILIFVASLTMARMLKRRQQLEIT